MTPQQLDRHLDEARDQLAPRWDPARAQRVLDGLPARAQRQRRRRRVVVASVAAVLVLGATGLVMSRGASSGVSVELVDATAQVRQVPSSLERRYEVHGGAARFVVHDREQPVIVTAAGVELEVMATRVLVEVVDGRARVLVEEGAVFARWPSGSALIRAGEPAWVPPLPAVAPVSPSEPVEPAPTVEPRVDDSPAAPVIAPAPAPRPSREKRRAPTELVWKRLAAIGDYQAAWLELQRAGAPKDQAAELLVAADVARLSGHPEAAVAPLQRVISAHRSDARAALAAFTLGRVMLDDLGRPREAMAAFASAGQLAPSGPLAEDALARQIEAASKAQHPDAHALALTFLERYPSSPRARAVRHFGGVP